MAITQKDKGERFAALHEGDPFVIPNPWDAGSARVLAGIGFRGLAHNSSGFAFPLGRGDGTVTLEEITAHVPSLADATEVPVSVDLEHGYGPAPDHGAEGVTGVAPAGAVGGSIEDYVGDAERPYEVAEGSERTSTSAERPG